jgi:ketosteroid isomerase-like protein
MSTQTTDLVGRVSDFYSRLDANDEHVLDEFLVDDASIVFNDNPPVEGRDQVRSFVQAWKDGFASVTHDIFMSTCDATASRVAVEIVVNYAFKDGGTIDVKGMSVMQFRDQLIEQWRVYVDTSKLV